MASSMVRAVFFLLLCSFTDCANLTEKAAEHAGAGPEDVTASSPVIVKLEQQTKMVEHGTVKNNFYSAVLSVGGPKPQEFRVGFDLGGGTSLLPSTKCNMQACLDRKKYDKCGSNMAEDVMRDGKLVIPGTPQICKRLKSFLAPRDVGTLEFHSLELGDGKAKGEFVRDKVCIDVQGGETRCFPFAFLSAGIMTNDPFVAEPYDGIVGLGPGTGGILSNDFDFLYRIIHAVPGNVQATFGLYLGSGTGGEIAFGGYDPRRMNSPISWAPLANVDDGRWQVTISAIRVGNSTLDVCSGSQCLAAFDHGTSFVGVPGKLEQQLEKQIGAAGPKQCEESKFPDLQLELNGITLTVPVQDYWPSNGKLPLAAAGPCVPDLEVHGMEESMSPGNHLFILGESVLRRYYTIYDAQSSRIGFSIANQEDDHPKKLRLKSDKSKASKDDNYVVLLVQVKVTSRKTRSTLLEDARPDVL